MNKNKIKNNFLDKLIIELDQGLKILLVKNLNNKNNLSPAESIPDLELSLQEIKLSSGLIRVDHTGEICAQALYKGQALLAKNQETRDYLLQAALEENSHLIWCQSRLNELGALPSYLNPIFYTASFLIGFTAALISDKISLGFVVETENQVTKHLNQHLEKISPNDLKSRAILLKMREDEQNHATQALSKGAAPLPYLIKKLMSAQSKIMTSTAYFI